jgi:hypothetical protein
MLPQIERAEAKSLVLTVTAPQDLKWNSPVLASCAHSTPLSD